MNAVMIHDDFYDEIERLEDIERSELLLALIREEEPEDRAMAALYRLMQAQSARFAKKQSNNGKKGGAPFGNTNAQKQPKQPKQPSVTNTVTNTITITNNEDLEAKASCRENPTPDVVREIVEHLNEKAKTSYRPSGKATQRLINARLNEGYKLDDFIAVIDKKCAEWLNSDMAKFLRPETLFGTKFESYLNQPARASPKQGTQPRRNVFEEIEARERAKENPEVIPDDTC